MRDKELRIWSIKLDFNHIFWLLGIHGEVGVTSQVETATLSSYEFDLGSIH